MQGLLLLLTTVFALAAAGEMNDKIQKAFNKCKEELNPPAGDIEMMIKKDLDYAYAKETKCLIACMLEEGRILRDGKYNLNNAIIMSDVIHKDNAEEAEKARHVLEHCASENPDVGSDKCEFAYKMAICGGHQAVKVGMKETPDFFE